MVKPDAKQRKMAGEVARIVLRPTVQAAFTVKEYGKSWGDLDLGCLAASLVEQTNACTDGDLARPEAMLVAQAHTLDAIFNNLARRAINAEYLDTLDSYLKLALRAQAQCRATLESLATIKNPPVVGYVRQANIAHGPQQINNAPAGRTSAPVEAQDAISQNELLGEMDGERLDSGTMRTAGQADPEVAPMGEGHRPKDRGR